MFAFQLLIIHNMLIYIIFATVAVSLISLAGILFFSFKSRRGKSIHYLVGFATGALLAFAFLDLLPEALSSGLASQLIFKVVLASILLFFIIEQFIHYHHCHCHTAQATKTHLIVNNLIGDGVHNFIDGSIIAAAFLINVPLGIGTTLAVALHEIPQEIADFSILIYAGLSRAKALLFNLLSGLTSLIGGILVFFLADKITDLMPILLALAAGNFIYLSMADLIPELHEERSATRILGQFISLMAGIALIYAFKFIV